INIVCKVLLMVPLAQVGLALATAIGAWINFVLVLIFAARAGLIAMDQELKSSLVRLAAAGVVLAVVLFAAVPLVAALSSSLPRFRNESELALMMAIGGVVYGGMVAVLFGRRWLRLIRRDAERVPVPSDDQLEGKSPAVERDSS